jgi:hypothetical protein
MPKHAIIALAKARRAWKAACQHDGIPMNSTFAEFSDNNPFIAEYSREMEIVLRYMA